MIQLKFTLNSYYCALNINLFTTEINYQLLESSLFSIHFEAHDPNTFFLSCDKILFVRRYFLFFNQVTLFSKLQAMAAKFYICMLLVTLVSSAVYSAWLRRPQDKETTSNFLYQRIFQGNFRSF